MEVIGGLVNAVKLAEYAVEIIKIIHNTYRHSGIHSAKLEHQLARIDRVGRALRGVEGHQDHPNFIENLKALAKTLIQVRTAIEAEIRNLKRSFPVQVYRDIFGTVHREHLKRLIGQLEGDEQSLLVVGIVEIHTQISNMDRFFKRKGRKGKGANLQRAKPLKAD